ncbi:HAD family hydrolase [Nocardia niigatensis]
MADFKLPVRCLAIDFGGTLASRSDEEIGSAAVVRALREAYEWVGHPAFTETLDLVMELRFRHERVSDRQTGFPDILQEAARMCGATLPDTAEAAARVVFDKLPDARIDPTAAIAVMTLAEFGFRLVLASNTRWPELARRQTLRTAGIEHCFHALVLSSELGLRKPHPGFYDAVLRAASCPPSQVLFVGDTADKDVDPPRLLGMQSLLVAPVWDQRGLAGGALPMFRDVPRLLGVAR